MAGFYKKTREVSQDLIQLLEDLVDNGSASDPIYQDVIDDHQALLGGIRDVSIISNTYSTTYRFLQGQMEFFKKKYSFTNVVLCKVMSQRVRDVIINSLRETQPIEIQDPDKES